MDLGQALTGRQQDLLSLYLTPRPNSMSAPKPTLGERLTDFIAGKLEKAGVGGRQAHRLGDKISGAADALTPFGSATEAQQAKRSLDSGNYLGAAGHTLGALLSALPDGGATLAHGVAHSIIAPLYHGSPHAFEKFALEKIGTGEGAQAYGHGLYFAENPRVAEDYRDTLAAPLINGRQPRASEAEALAALQDANGDVSSALAKAEHRRAMLVKGGAHPLDIAPHDERVGVLRAWKNHGIPQIDQSGHLYEVQLDANPEDFLNWDAPIGQQGEPVKNALSGLGINPNAWRGSDTGMPGDLAYHTVVERSMAPNTIGLVAEHNARMAATQRLNEAGVRGIRYLDQGSRGAGQGTHNYVVFDPNIIDILNRR